MNWVAKDNLSCKEKKHVGRMLEPLKSMWPLKGVTIASDGWSDPQKEANFELHGCDREWSDIFKGDQH